RRLLDRIHDGRKTTEIAGAAEALSYVTDDIAVPYLLDAIASRKPTGTQLEITGLERIGSPAARAALQFIVSMSQDPDPTTVHWTQDALDRLDRTGRHRVGA